MPKEKRTEWKKEEVKCKSQKCIQNPIQLKHGRVEKTRMMMMLLSTLQTLDCIVINRPDGIYSLRGERSVR